jgi:hypothetical protein
LDALAAFFAATAAEVHGESFTAALGDLSPDFSAQMFKDAYVGAFAVLWLQTSGEGAVCVEPFDRTRPKNCSGEPPDWVIKESASPAAPSPRSLLAAILAFFFALFGGLAGSLGALLGTVGTVVHASDEFWDEVRCLVYWAQYMLFKSEDEVLTFLHTSALGYPMSRHLGFPVDQDGNFAPAADETMRPLTKTGSPGNLYPHAMDGQGPAVFSTPDLLYLSFPQPAAELPSQQIWPSFGLDRYPNFALHGDGGGWDLLNGGMMASVPFPSRLDGAGFPLWFGNAVDNAVQVIQQDADGLPDYNLDADRGYGWLVWEPAFGELPSRPPIDAESVS